MKVRNRELEVDVLEELETFEWDRVKITGDEFQACSPFRDERKPSFYINTETGLYKDFGADSDHWKQGNLISLLSYLTNVSYEEAEDYLLEKYDTDVIEYEDKELIINIQEKEEPPKTFTREELKPYLFRLESYLLNRGISLETQKKFIVGYWKERKAVAFFWRDMFTGKVVTVKFRNVKGKQFFYVKGGQPVRNHVFALYEVVKEQHEKVYVVESEIDAMYLWDNGIPAIALGGSYLSPAQKRKLLLAGVETYVIATDKDSAGERIKNSILSELAGMVNLMTVEFPEYASDINEVKKEDIKKVTDSEEPATLDLKALI